MTIAEVKIQKYRKTLIAIAGAILTVAAQAFPDSKYTIAAIAVATAVGVWRVPNKTRATSADTENSYITVDKPSDNV